MRNNAIKDYFEAALSQAVTINRSQFSTLKEIATDLHKEIVSGTFVSDNGICVLLYTRAVQISLKTYVIGYLVGTWPLGNLDCTAPIAGLREVCNRENKYSPDYKYYHRRIQLLEWVIEKCSLLLNEPNTLVNYSPNEIGK